MLDCGRELPCLELETLLLVVVAMVLLVLLPLSFIHSSAAALSPAAALMPLVATIHSRYCRSCTNGWSETSACTTAFR
jgi:hypothetical protein